MRSKIVLQGIKNGVSYVYDKKGQPKEFCLGKGMKWVRYIYRGDNRVYFSFNGMPCGLRSIFRNGDEIISILLEGWSK